MDCTIKINMDNSAFEDESELPRILRKLAKHIENDPQDDGGNLMDVNGNKVGMWYVTE